MYTTLLWVPGCGELLIIMLFVLIFFDAKKLPDIERGMGKGIPELTYATKEITHEIKEAVPYDNKT